jgi:hypothetical protein
MGIISGIITFPINVIKWCVNAIILATITLINPICGLFYAIGRNSRKQHKKDVDRAVEKALKKKGLK